MTYFEKKRQLDYLRLYMIRHKKFAVSEALGKIFTISSDPFSFFHWNEVTDILNGLGPGQKAYEWKYVWKSICFRVFEQHQRNPIELTWQDKQIVRLLKNQLKLEEVGDHWYFVRRENSNVTELTEEELTSIYRIEADNLPSSPEDFNTEPSSNISNDANAASRSVEESENSTSPLPLEDKIDEHTEETSRQQDDIENIEEDTEIGNNKQTIEENCDKINRQLANTEENAQIMIKEETFETELDTEKRQLENNVEEANTEEIGQVEIKEEFNEVEDQAENNKDTNEEVFVEDDSQAENNTDDIRQEECEENSRQEKNDGQEELVEFRVPVERKKLEKRTGQENRIKRKDLEVEPNESNADCATSRSAKRRKPRSRPEVPEVVQNSNTKIQILRDISEAMKSIAVSFPQIANALITALEKD